ncbi:uncharacterized protein LOC129216011 [Uloborus diversus]|uniref:uncharacterized protein LOC129216011 n=1 Tax=Uloborus diversus TaxID=327109 RepID=UPI002409CA94|nr:uncharacterized protein LOC129216011 [Uloborus diversus]
MIERLHRPLKQAISCVSSAAWVDALPSVLLGLRTVYREDLASSVAELVYGETLRLPGDFVMKSKLPLLSPTFLQNLQGIIGSLRPTPASRHGIPSVFIPKDLDSCTHVFLRHDAVRRPLQPQYDGPFPVVKRMVKDFVISVKGSDKTVSIDRLKPAYLLNQDLCPDISTQTPVPVTTRSGRQVRFPDRFVSP